MMQATSYPPQPGMGPGHPGMAHGHPMQVQHMGQPNPAMMAGVHPGMTGPQVTQGPMVSGMPPNSGTPAPGGNPMQNAMAMAHLGGQAPMFQGQNPNMNMNPMQQQANLIARQRAMNSMLQAQGGGGQMPHGMMNMQNLGHLNPAQIQQMKAMNMPMQQIQHMTPQQQQMIHQQQQYQHQQRMMQQHAIAQHQQMAAQQQRQQVQQQQQHQAQQQVQQQQVQQAQQQQAQQQQQQAQQQQQQQAQQQQQQQAQQQHASQQMQMTRSQEQTIQPPQPVPTPVPQVQAPPQPQPPPTTQPQQQTPKPQPQQPQLPVSQPQQQQQNPPTPQVKQVEPDDENQIKPDLTKQQILMDDMARMPTQDFSGQCILQLQSYYDNLAFPARPNDFDYWREFTQRYYSPSGSIRQQCYSQRSQIEKTFQITSSSLARFYHSHFKNGIKKIIMQSFEHTQETLPSGGFAVFSKKLYVTYEYNDGVRVTAYGHLSVNFDDMQKIEHLWIGLKGWTEYMPRSTIKTYLSSLEQMRQSPKTQKKNLPKNQQQQQQQQRAPSLPDSPVSEWGLPGQLVQFLELAEVINIMGPLVQYTHQNPNIGPREALDRFNTENSQAQRAMAAQLHNNNAAAMNGQGPFPNQRMAGMNPPNQFQSPAFSHLGLPQQQGSPRINHTPSPAHNAAGGVQMVHQMSAQGSSNMSGSQGPSTNTSPNVTNKRRRASQIKEEDNQVIGGNSTTKPSPRVGGKRQKGGPA